MPKDLTRVCVQVIYCVVFLQGKTEFGEIKVKKEKRGGGYKKKHKFAHKPNWFGSGF